MTGSEKGIMIGIARAGRSAWLIGLLFGPVLLVGSSCTSVRANRPYAGPQELLPALRTYYSYPKQPIEARVQVAKQTKHYDVLHVEFPSALNLYGSEDIRVDYYMGKDAGRHPTVLLLPISGGVDFTVRSFARLFTSHGINCAIVHNREVRLEQTQSAEEMEAYFRQTVIDEQQVLDYLVARPATAPGARRAADRLPARGPLYVLSLSALCPMGVAAVHQEEIPYELRSGFVQWKPRGG